MFPFSYQTGLSLSLNVHIRQGRDHIEASLPGGQLELDKYGYSIVCNTLMYISETVPHCVYQVNICGELLVRMLPKIQYTF